LIITTKFYKGQGLGNQLWVYAVGRSIAEYLGFGFIQQNMESFKGKDFLDIDDIVNVDLKYLNSINLDSLQTFHEARYFDQDLNVTSSGFDERVKDIKNSVCLEGLYQSEKYFFGHLEKISNYIRIKNDFLKYEKMPNDVCIINLRGGEYKRHANLILPMEYWNNAIKNMKINMNIVKFIVVTDDKRYARAIFPEYEVLDGGVAECYLALKSAKYLILSNSSFSYFPTKTNNNTPYVIAPMYWARPFNSLKRWASPANLYEDWMWQDITGVLYEYKTLIKESESTELYYKNSYYLRSEVDISSQKTLLSYVPKKFKSKIKKIFSLINPKKYG